MFNTIDYLLFEKDKHELDNELLANFTPYMVARYLSFYDSSLIGYTNDTLNTYGNIFKSKEDQFLFFQNVIPKLKKKRIAYIKRPKEEKKKDEDPVPVPEFYSRREMDMINSIDI